MKEIGKAEVALFDELTQTQQLIVTKTVAEHLLTDTKQTLELTAINEATVYTVFRNLAVQIEVEIDTEVDMEEEWKFFWRRLTLRAYRECFFDEDADVFENDDPEEPWVTPQSEASRKLEQWDSLVESLADRILWDRDFKMAASFLDTEPAEASVLKQMLGIENDYYSSIAPDPTPDQVDGLLREVREITHRKPR